ncbi:hypothetical protein G3I43_25190 [Streptomyces anulatus]|uniref:Uncharacterized protein n=1 Tax=Streptomyces anulatus TaxID=1892 RepID=A0A6G3SWZ5_STRAQ|nr:hypothetical protein [Streptomyces anulatus]NDZ59883.1 hypothetical protein [Streptomyces anulatus]NEB87441.1 hypothetical protein [Streptomyces anulatus]
MISVITAVILSAIALDSASKVADEPSGALGGSSIGFEETRCEADRDAAPTQSYMKCLFEYQAANQQGAALWERETAARQADIQAKGNLAIIFGLLGVTFAVCAVMSNRGRRPEPRTTGT